MYALLRTKPVLEAIPRVLDFSRIPGRQSQEGSCGVMRAVWTAVKFKYQVPVALAIA